MDGGFENTLKIARDLMADFDTVIDLFDMCFIWVNESGAKASGRTPDEMLGHQISEFMDLSGISQNDIIQKTLAGDTFEIPVKKSDGKTQPIKMKHLSMQVDGNWYLLSKIL